MQSSKIDYSIIIVIFYTAMSAMEGREDIFKGFYGLQCARFLYISLDKKENDKEKRGN